MRLLSRFCTTVLALNVVVLRGEIVEANTVLMDWGKRNGAIVSDKVALLGAPGRQAFTCVEDIAKGEDVLVVPAAMHTSSFNIERHELPKSVMKIKAGGEITPFAAYFVQQKERRKAELAAGKGDEDPWGVYWDSVDLAAADGALMFWPEEELRKLGRSEMQDALEKKQSYDRIHHKIVRNIGEAIRGPFDKLDFFRAILWINSRYFGTGSVNVAPIAELINHNTYEYSNVDFGLEPSDMKVERLRYTARKAIKKGEEIRISYQDHGNTKLLRQYSFTISPVLEPSWSWRVRTRHIAEDLLPDLQLHLLKKRLELMTTTIPVEEEDEEEQNTDFESAVESITSFVDGAGIEAFERVLSSYSSEIESDEILAPFVAQLRKNRAAHLSSYVWWAEHAEAQHVDSSAGDAVGGFMRSNVIRSKMAQLLCLTAHREALQLLRGELRKEEALLAADVLRSHLAPIFVAIEQVIDGEKPPENLASESTSERLIAWVRQNGGTMSEKVGLTPSSFGGGFSVTAISNIASGETIFSIPAKIQLRGTRVRKSSVVPGRIAKMNLQLGDSPLAAHIVRETTRRQEERAGGIFVPGGFGPYWDFIEQLDGFEDFLDYWPAADAQTLGYGTIRELKWYRDAYEESFRTIVDKHRGECTESRTGWCKVGLGKFEKDSFLRAMLRIWSRQFYSSVAPLAEMLNHQPAGLQACWFAEDENKSLNVVSLRDIAAGEDVTINYNDHSNNEFLRTYGFTLPPKLEPMFTFKVWADHLQNEVLNELNIADVDEELYFKVSAVTPVPIQEDSISGKGLFKGEGVSGAVKQVVAATGMPGLEALLIFYLGELEADAMLAPYIQQLRDNRAVRRRSRVWWAPDASAESSDSSSADLLPKRRSAAVRSKMGELLCLTAHLETVRLLKGELDERNVLLEALALRASLEKATAAHAAGTVDPETHYYYGGESDVPVVADAWEKDEL